MPMSFDKLIKDENKKAFESYCTAVRLALNPQKSHWAWGKMPVWKAKYDPSVYYTPSIKVYRKYFEQFILDDDY